LKLQEPLSFKDRQDLAFSKRAPETGGWVFEKNSVFKQWLEAEGNKTLWCSGIRMPRILTSETTTDESYKLAPGKLLLRENDEVSDTSELQRLTRLQVNRREPLENQFFLQG
jgi:hypothetical protein